MVWTYEEEDENMKQWDPNNSGRKGETKTSKRLGKSPNKWKALIRKREKDILISKIVMIYVMTEICIYDFKVINL